MHRSNTPISTTYTVTYNADYSSSWDLAAASLNVGKIAYTVPASSGSGKIQSVSAAKLSTWANSGSFSLTTPNSNYVAAVVGNTYYEAGKYPLSLTGDLLASSKDPLLTSREFCIPKSSYNYICKATRVPALGK